MSESKTKPKPRHYEGDVLLPGSMRKLKRDKAGRPVPYFVQWVNGVPDFRIMNTQHLVAAIRDELCWVCGEKLLRASRGNLSPKGTFVAGPMCLVNLTSAEPPSHDDCAEASARICPFLTNAEKERRETNMPAQVGEMAGFGIMRNPGVTALISSHRWDIIRAGSGVLFRIGAVQGVKWMTRGREATSMEVLYSIDTGLPALTEMAATEPGGPIALARMLRDALRVLPPGTPTGEFPNVTAALAAL